MFFTESIISVFFDPEVMLDERRETVGRCPPGKMYRRMKSVLRW
jgi:hypothetical protein